MEQYKFKRYQRHTEDILEEAVDNTYKLLFDDWELSELITIGAMTFIINPDDIDKVDIELWELMVKHYEQRELYERCAVIKKEIDKYKCK